MAARRAQIAVLLGILLFCGLSYGLVFTIIGDWGIANLVYTPVIASRSTQRKSEFMVALGDNFYKGVTIGGTSHGVESVSDKKWQLVFHNQFPTTTPFFRKRWYVIAGNHDYDGNEMAQVQYTKLSHRWYFPSLYYHFLKPAPDGATVEFFMIDSQVLANDDSELASYGRKVDLEQLAKIERWLRTSTATWKIMFGHHPIYHNKNENDFLVKRLVPLLEKYHVAAYISGHLHSFQHLRSPKVHYITIGNTAIQSAVEKGNTPDGVREVFVHPTEAQWAGCGTDACKGFSIVKVKGKRSMVLEYWTSGDVLRRTISITNPNPRV
jgi:predicted phosphohydrolase